MSGVQTAVLVGVGLLVGGMVAQRLRLPVPLVLVTIGIGLGYVPGLSRVEVPPEVVLAVFLPPLLYWEAIRLSIREAIRNARAIVLLAVPLVLLTAAAVAGAGWAGGLPIAVAVALGAIVAPTDATAVDTIVTALPRSAMTTLRSESLINDGTALTVYAVAVSALSAGSGIDIGRGALVFVGASAGGVAVGVVVSSVSKWAHRLVRGNPLLENTASLLTPFLAFLPADLLHVSGVLGVVTCGLLVNRSGISVTSVVARAQARGFWQVGSSLISGALFFLVGLRAHDILGALGNQFLPVIGFGLLVAVVVVVVRLVWVNAVPYVLRLVDRPRGRPRPATGPRQRLVAGWAGLRGAVSLAAALALPPFPDRVRIIAITLTVILFTLIVQGLTMPWVLRQARLPADVRDAEEAELARRTLAEVTETALDAVVDDLHVPPGVVERLQRLVDERASRIRGGEDEEAAAILERALLTRQREALVRLHGQGRIDDLVLGRLQDLLDIEELRLPYYDSNS